MLETRVSYTGLDRKLFTVQYLIKGSIIYGMACNPLYYMAIRF